MPSVHRPNGWHISYEEFKWRSLRCLLRDRAARRASRFLAMPNAADREGLTGRCYAPDCSRIKANAAPQAAVPTRLGRLKMLYPGCLQMPASRALLYFGSCGAAVKLCPFEVKPGSPPGVESTACQKNRVMIVSPKALRPERICMRRLSRCFRVGRRNDYVRWERRVRIQNKPRTLQLVFASASTSRMYISISREGSILL